MFESAALGPSLTEAEVEQAMPESPYGPRRSAALGAREAASGVGSQPAGPPRALSPLVEEVRRAATVAEMLAVPPLCAAIKTEPTMVSDQVPTSVAASSASGSASPAASGSAPRAASGPVVR